MFDNNILFNVIRSARLAFEGTVSVVLTYKIAKTIAKDDLKISCSNLVAETSIL